MNPFDNKKNGMVSKCVLGTECKQKFAAHIKKTVVFCRTVTELRILAYKLTERYKLKDNFSND